MSGFDYTSKTLKIVNYSIVAAATWENAASEVKEARFWMIKARENDAIDTSFDYAFEDSPSAHMSSSGIGAGFIRSSIPPIWVRSTSASNIIEILYGE